METCPLCLKALPLEIERCPSCGFAERSEEERRHFGWAGPGLAAVLLGVTFSLSLMAREIDLDTEARVAYGAMVLAGVVTAILLKRRFAAGYYLALCLLTLNVPWIIMEVSLGVRLDRGFMIPLSVLTAYLAGLFSTLQIRALLELISDWTD